MNDHPIKRVIHFNLASQAAVILTLVRSVQHAVFHIIHRRDLVQPRLVNIAVSGCTSTGTAALGDDSIDIIVYGAFHDRVTVLNLDLVAFAVSGDVNYFGH